MKYDNDKKTLYIKVNILYLAQYFNNISFDYSSFSKPIIGVTKSNIETINILYTNMYHYTESTNTII